MTKIRLRIGAALVLCSSLVATAAADRPLRSLFDGRSLKGWQQITGKAEAWGVEDGLLVSRGEGGGWIGTTDEYRDFVLSLDFKLSPESNSGIYLRAPADTSHISRTGMEIQLLDDVHPRYKDIQPWQRNGALYHVTAPKPGHGKPTGEWNSIVIEANGPHLTITLNGSVVVDDQLDQHPDLDNEHPGLKRASGRIGLQGHNGRVEFRKIEVKEITPGSKS